MHFLNISTSKSVQEWCVLYICMSKPASRHSRVLLPHLKIQKCSDPEVLLTFWLPNLLRATMPCNFSSLISLKKIGKHSLSRLSTFSCTCILSLLNFSSLTLSTSALPSVHIVGSWLLNFLRSSQVVTCCLSRDTREMRRTQEQGLKCKQDSDSNHSSPNSVPTLRGSYGKFPKQCVHTEGFLR